MTLTRSLATSVPLNLQQTTSDVVNDLPKVSRARKLSKRLSLTFRSTLSLTKQAEDVKEATKSCKEEVLKKRRSWAVSMHTLFERSTPEQRAMNKTRSKSLHQRKGGFSTSDIPQVCNTLKRSVSSSPNTPVKTAHPYGKLDQYTRLEQLGEGSYATVYKGVSRVNNMFVAMKEIRLQADEGIPFTAIREASLLKDLRHANIVTLHDIIPTKQHLVLVFEYCHTDLCMFLEERPFGLHPINAKILLFQLLRGLKYIHKKKILHRDIKPQNVLLSNRGELKLADFGLARAKSVPSHTYTHEIVTLWYRPPDVLLGSTNYNTSLDIWGVGCIFVEMISGFPLFPGVKNAHDQLSKIFKTCGTPNRSDWPVEKFTYRRDEFPDYKKRRISILSPRLLTIEHCESLAEQMLQLQPDQRISAADAMRHPYFADLPEQLHLIHNQHSIFTVKGVKMCKDHKRPDSEQKARSSPRYLV